MRDRHVLQNEIEPPRPTHKILPHQPRDLSATNFFTSAINPSICFCFAALRCRPDSLGRGQGTDHLPLRDQLTRIKLRHDRFQHLVYDRGEDALVVVGAEFAVAGSSVQIKFTFKENGVSLM